MSSGSNTLNLPSPTVNMPMIRRYLSPFCNRTDAEKYLVESSTRAWKFQLDSRATRIALVLIEHPIAILIPQFCLSEGESSFEAIEGQSVGVSAAILQPLCRER